MEEILSHLKINVNMASRFITIKDFTGQIPAKLTLRNNYPVASLLLIYCFHNVCLLLLEFRPNPKHHLFLARN